MGRLNTLPDNSVEVNVNITDEMIEDFFGEENVSDVDTNDLYNWLEDFASDLIHDYANDTLKYEGLINDDDYLNFKLVDVD